jgi:hypothetical protein
MAKQRYPNMKAPCKFFDEKDGCMLFRLVLREFPQEQHYMVESAFGIGAGCCIKARAKNSETGVEVDFASLDPEVKRNLSRRIGK